MKAKLPVKTEKPSLLSRITRRSPGTKSVLVETASGVASFDVPQGNVVDDKMIVHVISRGSKYATVDVDTSSGRERICVPNGGVVFNVA